MNPKNKTTLAIVSGLLIAGNCLFSAGRVIAKAKQDDMLEKATMLLEVSEVSSQDYVANIRNPFILEEEVEYVVQTAEKVNVVISDAQVLRMASLKIKASGYMTLGDDIQYLILNGKKVHSGDQFPFVYKSKRHLIEITDFQTKSFSLKLNNETLNIPME